MPRPCGSTTWSSRSLGGRSSQQFRKEVADFYGDVFGWEASDVEVVGQNCLYLRSTTASSSSCAESDKPISSPGYDHLGLLMDTREEVDDTLARIKARAETDDRVRSRSTRTS